MHKHPLEAVLCKRCNKIRSKLIQEPAGLKELAKVAKISEQKTINHLKALQKLGFISRKKLPRRGWRSTWIAYRYEPQPMDKVLPNRPDLRSWFKFRYVWDVIHSIIYWSWYRGGSKKKWKSGCFWLPGKNLDILYFGPIAKGGKKKWDDALEKLHKIGSDLNCTIVLISND